MGSFAQSTANYAFSTDITASLVLDANGNTIDMGTGTSQLLGPNIDDQSANVTNIGFNFFIYGNQYTQFSTNSNGVMQLGSPIVGATNYVLSNGSTVTPRIGAFVANLRTGIGGKVHCKLVGTAPNRCLVVEYLNMSLTLVSSPGSNDGTYQVRLYETTGVIEFVYGTMFRNASGVSNDVIYLGFSVGSFTNNLASITTASNAVSYAAFNPNSYALSSSIPNLNSASDGNRRFYRFTPPAPVAAASALNFSAVAPTSMALNWTDNSNNEAGFAIYSSTDNATFTYLATVAPNATSYAATGLTPGTTYYWQVKAVTEGYVGNPVAGSQATPAPQTYTWVATAGTASWSTPASWSPARNIPDPTDILEFAAGGASTATGITTATVGRINVKNNTSISLQSSATAILTIASDGTPTDELNIAAGAALILNSTDFDLTLTYSTASSTGTIAGTAEVTSINGSSANNMFGFTASVFNTTTVTATGVLAQGQNGGLGSPSIIGGALTLIINGTYIHKFQTLPGTIPNATWNTGSKVSITGYTTVAAAPAGFGQTFYDVEWNCPLQTANIACSGTVPPVNGTFTLASTGTSSLALTATTAITTTWANYAQTGGVLDLATGASGASVITIPGTFNQSGGTFRSSGTGSANTTFNFTSLTTQSVTFNGQPTGPIIYRISATDGIALNANIPSFVIGNGTLGGLTISTLAATPITLGGSLTSLQYAVLNSTLIYNAVGSYAITATEFPAANGPANLRVAVGAGNILTMPASFGSRALSPTGASGILTMASGDLNISSNNFTLGTSAAFPGTLTYTAGNIRVTTGTFTRWFGTTGLPTSAGTGVGYFPLASGVNNRNVSISFSSSTALSTGGTLTIGHMDGVGTTAVSVTDGAYTIQQRTNAYWPISQSGLVASGTIAARVTGGGLIYTTGTNLRLMQQAAAAGTFVAGFGSNPNFQVTRTGLTVANIAQNQYIGAANADISFTSIASGNWENPAIWNKNSVPATADPVVIDKGTTVTVNATPATALSIAVNGNLVVSGSTLDMVGAATNGLSIIATGVFTLSGGTVTVGTSANNRTVSCAGTLTVSSGTMNINGNLATTSTSTFNQSGGNINVDGNAAGGIVNSVAAGTVLVSFGSPLGTVTGGNLTIVDPPFGGTARTLEINLVSGLGNLQWGTGHTTYFGNGTSTDASANTSGFQFDTYVGANGTQSMLGSVVVNGGSATNRWTTSTSSSGDFSGVRGNLTVNAGSDFRDVNLGGRLTIAGNIINNGTFYNVYPPLTFGDYVGGVFVPATNAQTISGNGVFRNNLTTATAQFTSISLSNTHTNGVTFAAGLIPTVSGPISILIGSLNADALILQGATAPLIGVTSAASFINVRDLTLNKTGVTFTGPGKVTITGTLSFGAVNNSTLATGGTLLLKSSAAGTGRIADITNNGTNTGNSITGTVTVERYIPAKASRTWSLVASPFTQAISSAWQQQVHITGAGTGGTVCPSLTAHTNGFDATLSNAASMFIYDGSKAVNTRWTSVTGTTGVNLTAGTGYRMNIRGARSIGCPLLDGSAVPVTAATLSSTGSLSVANKNYGSFAVTLANNGDATVANDNYLLTGNPYPSQVSFSALQAANSTAINNTYAIYAPGNTVGNYAIWNGATFTGGNNGLNDATGDIIANGQAFFVQGAVAGAGITLNWAETMKTATVNNGYFRQLNPNRLRIGYMLANGSRADEIMVQFAANATSDRMNSEDIVSLNAGTQYLKSLKAGNGLAFNTRNSHFTNDTVHLNLVSSTSGNFKLSFYDFDQFVNANNAKIYLVDSYMGTTQLMNDTKEYAFTVNMADAASQGTGRFAVVFSKPAPIAVPIAATTALKAYPNPLADRLTVELPQVDGGWILTILDMSGKVIMQQQALNGVTSLKTGKLAKGTYTLQAIDSKGNKQVQKLVKP